MGEQGMGKHGTPVKKDQLQLILENWTNGQRPRRRRRESRWRAKNFPTEGRHRQAAQNKMIKIAPFAEGLAMVGLDKDFAAGKPHGSAKGLWRGVGGSWGRRTSGSSAWMPT